MINQSASALLREVARLHLQLQRTTVATCGDTSSTQCFILGEIYRSGSITLADLGRQLALDKSWTSRAVESLVREGLVAKTPHDKDRRTVVVSLSKAGERRYEELDQALNTQAEQVMSRIPARRRAGIYKSLQLLRDALRIEMTNESSLKAKKTKCSR